MTRTLKVILLCGLLFVPCLALARGQAKLKIGKVTLRAGMPQEKALRLLRRSDDLSVVEDHTDAYLIKEANNGAILGTAAFKESKLVSASVNWGAPPSVHLASAPFANAVFEALDDLTGDGQSPCSVGSREWAGEWPWSLDPDHPRKKTSCITCAEKTTVINIGIAPFGDANEVSVNVNYRGWPGWYAIEKADGYTGPIRVGTVTLYEGMPEERALQLLRGSPDISASKVYEAPTLGQSWIFITGASTHTLISGPGGFECDDGSGGCPLTSWSVQFEASKIWSVSKFWILSKSDQLASAPFADAVSEDLNKLTGRFSLSVACTVKTVVTDPNLHDSATGSSTANNSLSAIKHVYISCGKKQVSFSIGTTAAGNNSSVDITESIFAK